MFRESAVQDDEGFSVAATAGRDLTGGNPQNRKVRGKRAEQPLTLIIAPTTKTLDSLAVSATPSTSATLSAPTFRLKRLFDIVVSSALLMVTLPVMVVVALLIRLSSPGPIILQQRRLTKDGREFLMFKFRSMRCDAESTTGPVLAQQNDARVTPIGRLIRLTRLDELPQLINVLRNEMSLIGPRPERPEIAEQLRREIPNFDARLRVKAGLTGLAQVEMGYSSCTSSYRRKLAFDRLYVSRQNLQLDCWIAFRTIWVMFTGRGAR